MAKLCDIVKPGVPCMVRNARGECFIWDGNDITHDSKVNLSHAVCIFANDWQLDEPTVESVLRERGYVVDLDFPIRISQVVRELSSGNKASCRPTLYVDSVPATAELATEICDLLDRLK